MAEETITVVTQKPETITAVSKEADPPAPIDSADTPTPAANLRGVFDRYGLFIRSQS